MARAVAVKRGAGGRLVSKRSKTGDPACSQAMSQWKTTGMTAAVAAVLGKCRAKARMLKEGASWRGAGREGRAQALEARAQRGLTKTERTSKAKSLLAERRARQSGASAPRPAQSRFNESTANANLAARRATPASAIRQRAQQAQMSRRTQEDVARYGNNDFTSTRAKIQDAVAARRKERGLSMEQRRERAGEIRKYRDLGEGRTPASGTFQRNLTYKSTPSSERVFPKEQRNQAAYAQGMARAERVAGLRSAKGAYVKPRDEADEPWTHTGSVKSPGTGVTIRGEGGPQRQIATPQARFTAKRLEKARELRASRSTPAPTPQAPQPVRAKAPAAERIKAIYDKLERRAVGDKGANVGRVQSRVDAAAGRFQKLPSKLQAEAANRIIGGNVSKSGADARRNVAKRFDDVNESTMRVQYINRYAGGDSPESIRQRGVLARFPAAAPKVAKAPKASTPKEPKPVLGDVTARAKNLYATAISKDFRKEDLDDLAEQMSRMAKADLDRMLKDMGFAQKAVSKAAAVRKVRDHIFNRRSAFFRADA